LIENYSTIIESIKSRIGHIEDNSRLVISEDQNEYKMLTNNHNEYVSKYNEILEEAKKFKNQYELKSYEISNKIEIMKSCQIEEETIKKVTLPISENVDFFNYILLSYSKISFQWISAVEYLPTSTPSIDINSISFGMFLLFLKQIALFFSLFILWLWSNRQKYIRRFLMG
jgi:hypothetical protein